jgi:hypothetical protein
MFTPRTSVKALKMQCNYEATIIYVYDDYDVMTIRPQILEVTYTVMDGMIHLTYSLSL